MSYFESALGTGLSVGFGVVGMIAGGAMAVDQHKEEISKIKDANLTDTRAPFGKVFPTSMVMAGWFAVAAYFAGDYIDGNKQPQQPVIAQPVVPQP